MEIKVNEEIRNIKETFILGLSMRQTIWSLMALLAGVGVYFLVKDTLSLEFAISLSMLAATPFACLGFVTIQGMTFEKIFIELINSYIVNPFELYNTPKNNFAIWKHEEEYNSPEAIKERNRKKTKKISVIVSIIVLFTASCVVVSAIGNNIAFQKHKETEYDSLISNYDKTLYESQSLIELNSLMDNCYQDLDSIETEKELNTLLRTYKNKFNSIPTYPEQKAQLLEDEYSEQIAKHPELSVVLETWISNIKTSHTIKIADNLYEEAKTSIDNEIHAQTN